MKKYLLILFCLLSIACPNRVISRIDSLENIISSANDSSKVSALNELSGAYLFISPQRSLQLSKEALELSKKYYMKEEEGRANYNIGSTFLAIKYIDSSLIYLPKAFAIYQTLGDTINMANVLRAVGDAYSSANNYLKAQEAFNYSLSLFDEIYSSNKNSLNVNKHFSLLLNNFGAFYIDLENYPEAIKYFTKAIELYIKQNRKQGQALAYYNIGFCYDKLNNYEQALTNYSKAINFAKESKSYSIHANSLLGIATLYMRKNESSKALEYLKKAEPILISIEDNIGLYNLYKSFGASHFSLKKYQISLKYFKNALEFAELSGNKINVIESYKNLSDAYSKLGDYKESFDCLQKFINLKDSVNSIEKNKKIEELDAKIKTEQQLKEFQELKNQNAINDIQNSRLTSVIISLGLIIVLISFLTYELYKRNIERAQVNELLAEKNREIEQKNELLLESNATKDKFFSIIAHDLRNPIGSFKELSEILFENYNDFSDSEKIDFIKSLHTNSKSLFALLDNLLDWSRSQRGVIEYTPENLPINMLMDYYVQNFKEQATNKNISIEINIPPKTVIFADQYLISTIVKNLISNAIKFTNYGGKLTISAVIKNSFIEFAFADNGVGISENRLQKLFKLDEKIYTLGTNDEVGAGLGLILCQEFVNKQGGEIWIESEEGKGTTAYFNIPKKDIVIENYPTENII